MTREDVEVAYIIDPTEREGTSSQAKLIVDNVDEVVPFAFGPWTGDETSPLIEKEREDGFNIFIGNPTIKDGLDEIDPDMVMLHAISKQVIDEIDEIMEEYPVVWRFGTNLLEQTILTRTAVRFGSPIDLMNRVDAIIPPDKHVAKDLKVMGINNVSRPIPPMIDVGMWSNIDTNFDSKNIVSVSRYSPVKNLYLPMMAMDKLCVGDRDVNYLIYGKGEMNKMLSSVLEAVRSPNIRICGSEPAENILGNATVFIQTSLSENRSVSVLEARAAGIPQVVSDIDGHKGASNPVKHDSLQEMYEEAKRLMYEEEYRRDMIEKGKEGIERYDIDNVVPLYEELFEKVSPFKEHNDSAELYLRG